MWHRLNAGGLVIAGIGFFLTRFTVTLALNEEPLKFYVAGVVPLVLGLGLAAFGVALAVGDVDADLVRTTAAWCVLGTAAMAVLVALTIIGSSAGEMPDIPAVQARSYLANFLIGGSVGGTLTGLYSARSARQRRALDRHANRLEVLNRMLRHEVLNAVTAIRGYTEIPERAEAGEHRDVVLTRTGDIEATIEEVKYLSRTADPTAPRGSPIDLRTCLEASVADVRARLPAADVSLDPPPAGLTVLANERVEQVFTHLLENAVLHADSEAPAVSVSVETAGQDVRISVTDDGPGLPARQRDLLESGTIGEFDDPTSGFGLNVVRLLVESYRGEIETSVSDAGSTVTVVLPRGRPAGDGRGLPEPNAVGVSLPRLPVTVAAALLAGVAMGLTGGLIGGSIPVIGSLYGVQSGLIGWITHEFHSIVFGIVFAGLVGMAPERYQRSPLGYVAIGTGWALVLWFAAAGLVMPLWLQLVGIPASLPSLTVISLVIHLVWGVSMGLLTWVGFGHVAPRLASRLGDPVAATRRRLAER
jgi:signal transduction histidine kinase